MEIIKKVNSRSAWIRISDTEARLITFEKDVTNMEMITKGKEIKEKRDRLKFIQEEIAKLKK